MKRISPTVRSKAKAIRLLLLDVDGVLTDGGIIIDDRGLETKRFDVRDGQGIALLQMVGIDVGFITGRSSGVVRHRARELGVKHLYQGVKNKLDTYDAIKRRTRLGDRQIAYVGDDLGDVQILKRVGFSATVPNAGPLMARATHYVTQAAGGYGAVREIAELLLRAQNTWSKVLAKYFS